MIVVRLAGGLGNQMFQYATAKRLAHRHEKPLKFDLSSFTSDTRRTYRLHVFGIHKCEATSDEIQRLIQPTPWHRLVDKVFYQRSERANRHIREKSFRFNPDILNLPGWVYLNGYWQSEKYFTDIGAIIRREFSFKPPLTDINKQIAGLIQSCNSVSIHIRRTDYITDPGANYILGPCSVDYYNRGVAQIEKMVTTPHFFIFSDDLIWVRENLRLSYPMTFVDHNGPDQDFEDMRLMSLCRHHIIANSTFSWWGAWLCTYPQKVVIAPRRWFNSPERDASDLVPDSWLRM